MVDTVLVYRLTHSMQAKYELKVQAIRSKGQQARLYVYFPLPLAAAIGILLLRREGHGIRRPSVAEVRSPPRMTGVVLEKARMLISSATSACFGVRPPLSTLSELAMISTAVPSR